MPRPRLLRMALAIGLAMASAAPAERLLVPLDAAALTPGARAGMRGVARVRRLGLDPAALAALRAQPSPTVADFPLGAERTATLELARFTPFTADARAEVVDAGGVRALALPDHVYFAGTVRGEPDSHVFLAARRDGVHGFVQSGGVVYAFGPDGAGTHRSYALRDVDPAVYPPPGDFCGNDLHADAVEAPRAAARALAEAHLAPPPILGTQLRQARVAVETDYELRQKFGSEQAALDWLASLVAAVSAIDERDNALRIRFSYIRLWSTPGDPWSATDTLAQLDEVQGYWTNPTNHMPTVAGPYDTVHFVSGKPVQGGIAYLSSICDPTYGFGVSQVFGSFDLSTPSQIWDVLVVTHELGHNLGTPHTHCYNPPIDRCYNQEQGCYSGAVVPSRGTIMSYCHLVAGGLANIDMVFGSVVSAQIAQVLANATCLQPVIPSVCGNGVVEYGEQCDDGNTTACDGCSASCRLETCGNGVKECAEECDDGNTTAGDGCSATCTREPRCGDAVVDPGEECDAGAANGSGDSGCSATCKLEPCVVLSQLQTVWPRAGVTVDRRGAAHDRLTLRGDFGIAVPVGSLALPATGLRVMIADRTGTTHVDVTVPAGGRWIARPRRWLYRDPTGGAAGIRKLVLRDRSSGGVNEVEVTVTAQKGSYPLGPTDLPLGLTLVLGDAGAGKAGACGHYAFGGGSCGALRGGARLVCR